MEVEALLGLQRHVGVLLVDLPAQLFAIDPRRGHPFCHLQLLSVTHSLSATARALMGTLRLKRRPLEHRGTRRPRGIRALTLLLERRVQLLLQAGRSTIPLSGARP